MPTGCCKIEEQSKILASLRELGLFSTATKKIMVFEPHPITKYLSSIDTALAILENFLHPLNVARLMGSRIIFTQKIPVILYFCLVITNQQD